MWKAIKISQADSDQLFEWRNSPEVYKFLFNPFPIEKKNHEAWLSKIMTNKHVAFYKMNFNGDDVGTVRFDFEENLEVAEVGIYLAPKFHGAGLGTPMLDASLNEVKKEFKSLKKIIAKVVPENIASEKMFLKNGFNKKYIQLEKEL